MPIAREQRDLSNIRRLHQSSYPALQADGEASMWRHPGGEGLQIGLVELQRLPTGTEDSQILAVAVKALTSSHQFHSTK